MKTVSQISPAGVFVGPAIAHESPLEPGIYHLPAGTVDVAPPEVPQGQIAVLIDGAWAFAPAPALPADDPVPPTLDGIKRRLTEAATARRWTVETGGITLPNGVEIKTGTDDQARITSVIASAHLAGVTAVDFKAASGWVTLTLTEVEQIAGAIALHVQACFAAERAHHQAIEQLADSEDAQDYDITAGWPGQGA